MLASINPLGERARGTTFARTFCWYLTGSIAGGAVVGATAGALGAAFDALVELSATARAISLVVVALAALVLELGIGGAHVPTTRRQVNEDWLSRYRGWVYGVGFGFELGLGVVTVVTTALVYLMLWLAFLTGSPVLGVVIGVVFGSARALPLLLVGRVAEHAQLRQAVRRAHGWAPIADRLARGAVVMLTLSGMALAVWAGP